MTKRSAWNRKYKEFSWFKNNTKKSKLLTKRYDRAEKVYHENQSKKNYRYYLAASCRRTFFDCRFRTQEMLREMDKKDMEKDGVLSNPKRKRSSRKGKRRNRPMFRI